MLCKYYEIPFRTTTQIGKYAEDLHATVTIYFEVFRLVKIFTCQVQNVLKILCLFLHKYD